MQALKIEDQSEVDAKNRSYWNTLCGSQLAQSLGITDFSKESLRKFDEYYLGYYPYLLPHILFDSLKGKKILEIGLGYGTLAEKLASIASDYTGLDIAQGPVDLVNERLRMHGYTGRAVQGSILTPPFEPASFDAIVSIGCLHHTGNMGAAIEQVKTLLKPGGSMAFMVYNAYSYRRWLSYPTATAQRFMNDSVGIGGNKKASQNERSAYDKEAPETAFASAKQLRALLADMRDVNVIPENASPENIFRRASREWMLRTIAPYCGLDLYVQATKV